MGTTAKAAYDIDFADWCAATAELIRTGRWKEVDLQHVAEEIEDMGKRDRREATNRTRILLMHLLKWVAQPAKRSPSWKSTIIEQRRRLNAIFADSGSLRSAVRENLDGIYQDACKDALIEMGIDDCLPPVSAWSMEQILDMEYFPDTLRSGQ